MFFFSLQVGTLGNTFVGSLMRTLLGVLAVPPPLNLSPGLRDPPHSVQTCGIELLLSALNRSPLARWHLRDLWTDIATQGPRFLFCRKGNRASPLQALTHLEELSGLPGGLSGRERGLLISGLGFYLLMSPA